MFFWQHSVEASKHDRIGAYIDWARVKWMEGDRNREVAECRSWERVARVSPDNSWPGFVVLRRASRHFTPSHKSPYPPAKPPLHSWFLNLPTFLQTTLSIPSVPDESGRSPSHREMRGLFNLSWKPVYQTLSIPIVTAISSWKNTEKKLTVSFTSQEDRTKEVIIRNAVNSSVNLFCWWTQFTFLYFIGFCESGKVPWMNESFIYDIFLFSCINWHRKCISTYTLRGRIRNVS